MTSGNLEFFSAIEVSESDDRSLAFVEYIKSFEEFGTKTQSYTIQVGELPVPVFVNEFWTSKQRAAHRIHEVSYRACFKPQLPRFFIDQLTQVGDTVLDPFMGRGTTLVEAVLMNRFAVGCDINPLSRIICEPRLNPPELEAVANRLESLDLNYTGGWPEDLEVFYHRKTLEELCSLRQYFAERGNKMDAADKWIQMVATNRLTGHSPGFFSVYTLPPNQAVTADRQRLINEKRNQTPEYRDVKAIILKKSRTLLKEIDELNRHSFETYGAKSKIVVGSSIEIPGIKTGSVNLVVTSPPFLDVVDYATDNWLRSWFNHIDPQTIPITILRKVEDWRSYMTKTFARLKTLLKKGGYVAFEVGEVKNGKIKLEDHVIPAAEKAGLVPILVLVNDQEFTKTSNCWGVSNLEKGTNTNRIVLLRKQ
ncbi:MAG: DNA methyltransferase [Verrucomicrobia bacterium]|nr:DNA methyltransferase [Verrucomicrobiota bacterium]MDA1069750.1 DNA methyltransferase [Verrucomicrobiota bacterium]